MNPNDFSILVQRFFGDYLTAQRALSPETRASYRTTFRLLLRFLSAHHRCSIDTLRLSQLTPETVLVFLQQLEDSRGNCPRTRNNRLAAIKTFVRFVHGQSAVLDYLPLGQRILQIPHKKYQKTRLGYMSPAEIEAILAAIDQKTWAGRRDFALLSFLYNTGARISETLHLYVRDVHERYVQLHGKGRKERPAPIWPQTHRLLHSWCRSNQLLPDHLMFQNCRGGPLSHDGISARLKLAVSKASHRCPELHEQHVTPHRFRASCAMSLLEAGVAPEVISLYLGHEHPQTTHDYIRANLKMKARCMERLTQPKVVPRRRAKEESRLLAFLEALP